jgi:UrcA family protein
MGAYADGATDHGVRRQMVIHFGDLNPSNPKDAGVLLARIERAAKTACGGQPTFSSYTGHLDGTFEECRGTAIRKAVERLGSPTLTRVYTEARKHG